MRDNDGIPTFSCTVEREGSNGSVFAIGEIDLASSPQLRAAIVELLDDGVRRLVVDLGEVTFIDSSGLGVLVGALKRANETPGTTLLVRGLNGPARKVFEITGLDVVFGVD